MKGIKYMIVLLASVLVSAFFSCEKNGGEKPDPDFIISKYSISFAKEGGVDNFSVKTEGTVQVSCDASWLKVVEKSSASATMHPFEVTATTNTATEERNGKITVSVGSKSETIEVSQDAADGLVIESYNPSSLEFTHEGGELTVTLLSNGDYTVTPSASWITDSGTKSEPVSSTRRFDIARNYSAARTATITFSLGDISESLTINQEEYKGVMESDAIELASRMFAGINIGNTLEATGGETAWGNPMINQAYIKGLKDAGFNAVRIPCSWHQYIVDQSTYKVRESWLDRVNEVVGYVVSNDMYAIVNIHWDQGWLENNISKGYDPTIDAEQKAIWTQIADKLNSYDEHLLFAGCNEPNAENASQMATLKIYEQTFIDAVRATGGNNAVRCLVVQGPNTDVDKTFEFGEMPQDIVENRLMMEVHYYSPYNFCMMEKDETWGNMFFTWGEKNHVSGSTHNPTWGEEDFLTDQFAKIKSKYSDKGIPTILGEYSAMYRSKTDYGMTEEEYQAHLKSVAYYNECVTREAKNHGLVPFHWDTGSLFNRNTGAVTKQDVLQSIIKGATDGKYPY